MSYDEAGAGLLYECIERMCIGELEILYGLNAWLGKFASFGWYRIIASVRWEQFV